MTTKTRFQTFAVLLIAALTTLFAQGPLTPPGAPAPTMKSLDQIEARTPISSAPFTINQPGSYYLTTNLTVSSGNAITIAANGVTLDLNGFTLSSTEASPNGAGVLLSSSRVHIHIFNGHISGNVTYSGGVYAGSGFASGIVYSGSPPRNARVTGVSVSRCLQHGIHVPGFSNVIESCAVYTVGGNGIVASTVSHSTAQVCGLNGIFANVALNCDGESNGSSPGVAAVNVQNCYGLSSTGDGVQGDTVQNCYGRSSGNGHGVTATSAEHCWGRSHGSGNGINAFNTVHNSYGQSASGNGVNATNAHNCYGTTGAGVGVRATYTASNCFGSSGGISGPFPGSGEGVYAAIARDCYGTSTGNGATAVRASVAENCHGIAANGTGVGAVYAATNCFGASDSGFFSGLFAGRASNCHGNSASYIGLTATGAAFCHGYNGSGTQPGVSANIAIGCTGVGSVAVSATNKYLMP